MKNNILLNPIVWLLFIYVGFIIYLTQKRPVKSKQVYIPVVIDSSKVALIHGQDTVYLYMDNATILQEVPVLYLEQ